MNIPFHVIIPARFASTRLPAKPLLDIVGKPMIQHVYERALQSGAKSVTVATDDERIKNCVEAFGGKALLTSTTHVSGTDRVLEAAEMLTCSNEDIIVNVQGDEPLIPPENIQQVAEALIKNPTANMATLCEPVTDNAQIFNPNVVKVVMDNTGFALYFSRAPIPWNREAFDENHKEVTDLTNYHRHIGIYAYRLEFLKQFVTWQPAVLEKLESLEQLRTLAYGAKIFVEHAKFTFPAGVDTAEDLQRIRKLFPSGL